MTKTMGILTTSDVPGIRVDSDDKKSQLLLY